MDPHRRGELTELVVQTELKRRGVSISTPVGDNERYDLVLERPSGDLLRAQVKTGWTDDGVVEFKGKTQHTNATGHVYKRYGDDVDCFLVYSYATEQVYYVPATEVGTSMRLRIDPPNQQSAKVHWAEASELDERWPPTDQ